MKRRDRIIGIVLGILLGLGIVTAFVFLGSEQAIDAPSLSGKAARGQSPGPAAHHAKPKPKPKPKKKEPPPEPGVATVRVIGGTPPPSGPAHLDYGVGERVRLRIVSDETVDIQLLGYPVSGTVTAGQPTRLEFHATKRGNFPLIVTASHIAIAQIRIGQPSTP